MASLKLYKILSVQERVAGSIVMDNKKRTVKTVLLKQPVRESNSCFRRERATS